MFRFGLKPKKEETITKRAVNAAIRERLRGNRTFFPNAKEREAGIKGAITAVTIGLMRDLLIRVTYELAVAHGFKEDEADAKALTEKMGHIVIGFEAVRSGYDPDGPETMSDPLAMGGAKVADSACYIAALTGAFDRDYIAGNLRYLLGFSRDGSEIRQNVNE